MEMTTQYQREMLKRNNAHGVVAVRLEDGTWIGHVFACDGRRVWPGHSEPSQETEDAAMQAARAANADKSLITLA